MPGTAIVGLQWGDEAKGKIVDFLSSKFKAVARYQGGPNAGHTVYYKKEKLIFHQIPSGILNPSTKVYIGAGCVIDPFIFMEELRNLDKVGIDYRKRIMISYKAHLILPTHRLLDVSSDDKREKKIGVTGRGIGPCYEDKHARRGLRIDDIAKSDFKKRVIENMKRHYSLLQIEPVNFIEEVDKFTECCSKIYDFAGNVSLELLDLLQNSNVLFEGAQGTFLDIDHGTYPFVTSSNPITGGIPAGLGIPPKSVDKVIGVAKAYTTRVGGGPFPTEAEEEIASIIREIGNEFGSTTGRPRRCGWLDIPMLRYAVKINGVDGIAITKLDVLDSFDEIKICIGYDVKGKKVDIYTPELPHDKIKPIYETLKGWKAKTKKIRKFELLPYNAQKYIEFIKKETGVKIYLIGVGENREETIVTSDFPF